MKKTIFSILCAFLIFSISSCEKQSPQEPFFNSYKKFEFQNTSYVYTDGKTVEFIYLSSYSAASPEKTTVEIFKGVIGGQKSFSEPTPAQNFIYITDSASYEAIYGFNDLKITTANGSESIKANTTGSYQSTGTPTPFDYRKIVSLTYQGKTFLPRDNESYFIANENQVGVVTSRMITQNKPCGFKNCVNGVSENILWNYSGNTMTINAGNTNIVGNVIGTKYATPMIQTSNGDLYVIQFYTLADNQQVACTCTMNFNLYKVIGGSVGKTDLSQTQFQLIIGGC